jgi:hypothetical protein
MPAKRLDAASKAEQLLNASQLPAPVSPARSAKAEGTLPKITGRVFPEQLRWVKEEIRSYRARHPRRPKLTIDLVMRVALDHLKDADNFDAVVHKHLS